MDGEDKILILKTSSIKRHISYLKNANKFPKPQIISAKNLQIGDYLLEEVINSKESPETISYNYSTHVNNKTNILKLEPDLMRLAGYWIAEGSLSKTDKCSNGKKKIHKQNVIYYKYKVSFAFNINEIDYIEDIKNLMKKYFGVSSTMYRARETNGISLNFNTRKGYEFFGQFFGRGAINKKMPEYFICLDCKLLKELLKGFWRGDGSLGCQNSTDRRTAFTFCSTSKILIEQVRKVLLRFQVNPSFHIRTPEMHHSNIVNGYLIKAKHDLNTLSIYGNNAEILNGVLGENYGNFSSKNFTFFTPDNKYAIFKVKSIKSNE